MREEKLIKRAQMEEMDVRRSWRSERLLVGSSLSLREEVERDGDRYDRKREKKKEREVEIG